MARKEENRHARDPLSTLDIRKQHLVCGFILLILPVLLFFPTVLGDKQFMGHDTIQWRAGATSIFDYRDANQGEEPLWAPNMFGGMPAYTVHVYKAVPHLDSHLFDQLRIIWPAIPYWVLLFGSYFYFLLLGARPLTATFGAVLIAFTSYIPIIIGAGHNIKFIAYSWIPWMLAGYHLITRTERQWGGLFLLAVSTTLHLRAAHPQVTYYFFFLFLALFLYEAWSRVRKGDRTAPLAHLLWLAAAALLALFGTADQLLRLLEYSPHSIRGGSPVAEIASTGGLSMEYAFSWSQGIAETLTLIIPDLFGGSSTMAYWGDKPGTAGPHYFGAVAFLLFLIGVVRSRRRIRFLFLGVGVLAITFAWGHHFPINRLWFHLLPGFDKFRTPEMWLILTVVCFSVIAVFGAEALLQLAAGGKKEMRRLWLPAGIALGTGLVLFAGTPLLSFESERERDFIVTQLAEQNQLSPENGLVQQRASQIIEAQLKPERREMARRDILRYLFYTSFACLLIAGCFYRKIGPGTLMLFLVLLASADLLTASARYVSDRSLVDRNLDLVEVIERSGSPADRYIRDHHRSAEGFPWRALPLDDNPFNNAIPSAFYPSLGGYSGAKLSLIQDVIEGALFTGPAGINMAVLNMMNVKFISARRPLPLPGLQELFREEPFHVYENLSVLPKAWFVNRVTGVSSSREAFGQILPESGFRPSESAVVEGLSSADYLPDEEEEVEVAAYSERRIELLINRSVPGFLVLSEIWYPPGWSARLNGEPVPIWKTNYLLRGFEIPPGQHRLELTFDPASHRWGTRISWGANLLQWLIGAGLLLSLRGNQKRTGSGRPDSPSGAGTKSPDAPASRNRSASRSGSRR